MKKPLERYGFSEATVRVVKPIIEAFEHNKVFEAEKITSELALQVCSKIESGALSPKEANDYFLLLDLYKTDHFPELKLREEVEGILFEGMILHDYGKEYGANLTTIKDLANQVLKKEH